MLVIARAAAGIFLLAHGLVHFLYLVPGVPEFSLDRSWLIPKGARSPLGIGLLVATVAGFSLSALAVWGVPGLSPAWPAVTGVASLLSALLLVLFWTRSLAIGLAIDVALLATAVLRPDWAEQFVNGGI